jgi:hypothetical protein
MKDMSYRDQEIEIPKPTSFWGDVKAFLQDFSKKHFGALGMGIAFLLGIVLSIPLIGLAWFTLFAWAPLYYAWLIGRDIQDKGFKRVATAEASYGVGLLMLSLSMLSGVSFWFVFLEEGAPLEFLLR